MLPDHGVTVAVMCNLETIDPVPLARQAAHVYLGLAPEPAAIPSPTPTMPAESIVSLSQDELTGYAGAYLDRTSTRFVRLYVEGDRLKLEDRLSTELAPLLDQSESRADTHVVFRRHSEAAREAVFMLIQYSLNRANAAFCKILFQP